MVLGPWSLLSLVQSAASKDINKMATTGGLRRNAKISLLFKLCSLLNLRTADQVHQHVLGKGRISTAIIINPPPTLAFIFHFPIFFLLCSFHGRGAKISQLIEYLKLPNRNFKFITPKGWSLGHYLTCDSACSWV